MEGVTKRFSLQKGWRETLLNPRRRDLQTALEGVSLEVRPGEFFGLLGQNGAGKTTLFKILATLVVPDAGTVTVGEYDALREPHRVREILTPVIPNDRSLYWRLSARENLRLYAALHGLKGERARRRVDQVLEVVGLQETGGKQVGLFSSGMKQRLLIGRALLGEPRVLLLDEPTRSLDPVSARDFRRFLREEIGGAHNCTVLLATHDREEVRELCHRIGILDRGRLLALGSTGEIMARLRVNRYAIRTRPTARRLLERVVEGWGGAVVPSPAETAGRTPDPPGSGTGSRGGGAGGWGWIHLELPTGVGEADGLLAELVGAGVPVADFRRDELSLAEVLERVVAEGGGGGEGR